MAAPLDLSTPSFKAAVHFARQAAMEGHPAPAAVMAKLLMHVEAEDGGLFGADDAQARLVCRRCKISPAQYADALYAPRPWPVAATAKQVAA